MLCSEKQLQSDELQSSLLIRFFKDYQSKKGKNSFDRFGLVFGLGGGKGRRRERCAVSGKCPPENFTLHHTSQLHENSNEKTNLGHTEAEAAVQHMDLHKFRWSQFANFFL